LPVVICSWRRAVLLERRGGQAGAFGNDCLVLLDQLLAAQASPWAALRLGAGTGRTALRAGSLTLGAGSRSSGRPHPATTTVASTAPSAIAAIIQCSARERDIGRYQPRARAVQMASEEAISSQRLSASLVPFESPASLRRRASAA
jgi:hypothetical protein